MVRDIVVIVCLGLFVLLGSILSIVYSKKLYTVSGVLFQYLREPSLLVERRLMVRDIVVIVCLGLFVLLGSILSIVYSKKLYTVSGVLFQYLREPSLLVERRLMVRDIVVIVCLGLFVLLGSILSIVYSKKLYTVSGVLFQYLREPSLLVERRLMVRDIVVIVCLGLFVLLGSILSIVYSKKLYTVSGVLFQYLREPSLLVERRLMVRDKVVIVCLGLFVLLGSILSIVYSKKLYTVSGVLFQYLREPSLLVERRLMVRDKVVIVCLGLFVLLGSILSIVYSKKLYTVSGVLFQYLREPSLLVERRLMVRDIVVIVCLGLFVLLGSILSIVYSKKLQNQDQHVGASLLIVFPTAGIILYAGFLIVSTHSD